MQMLVTTVVSVQLFMGCMILNCDAIALSSQGSIEGNWTFREGGVVTLTCQIPSYLGDMEWKLDSAIVAKCTPQGGCNQIMTGGEGLYLFGFDKNNKRFHWTFTSVKSLHNDKVIECFDGTNSESFTTIVKDKVTVSDNENEPAIPIADAVNLTIAVAAIACVEFFIILILLLVVCCNNCRKRYFKCCPKTCNISFITVDGIRQNVKEIMEQEWDNLMISIERIQNTTPAPSEVRLFEEYRRTHRNHPETQNDSVNRSLPDTDLKRKHHTEIDNVDQHLPDTGITQPKYNKHQKGKKDMHLPESKEQHPATNTSSF